MAYFALKFVKTENVIILNDDLEVISPDWIESLLSYSQMPGVGAVGGMLIYPDNKIQHAGVVLGVNGVASHIFHNQPANQVSYCGYSHIVRNYSAVTGAVIATKLSIIKKIGYFNEKLKCDYNDIDFCLRLQENGYRVVYNPFAQLYHFEGSTLKRTEPNESDKKHFMKLWAKNVNEDPYYNPSLPKNRTDCLVLKW